MQHLKIHNSSQTIGFCHHNREQRVSVRPPDTLADYSAADSCFVCPRCGANDSPRCSSPTIGHRSLKVRRSRDIEGQLRASKPPQLQLCQEDPPKLPPTHVAHVGSQFFLLLHRYSAIIIGHIITNWLTDLLKSYLGNWIPMQRKLIRFNVDIPAAIIWIPGMIESP